MAELGDHQLLVQYARTNSDAAFAALVERHLNLVYSAARRFAGNPHHAEEIAQAVFVILARKAGALKPGTVLAGWLYRTTRLTAANFVRREIRRQRREQEACMQSTLNEPPPNDWDHIAPLLDDVLGRLSETDRNAILLRFFENKTARELGVALQLTEATARKRVVRALEKLRRMFAKRGVTLSTAAIAAALSASSASAAPTGLPAMIAAGTRAAAATDGAVALAEGVIQTMTWATLNARLLIGAGAAALLAGGAIIAALWLGQSTRPLPASSPRLASAAKDRAPLDPFREPLTETVLLSLDSPAGAVAVQPDGRIVVGSVLFGFFVDSQRGALGYYRRGAMRLQPDGELDRTFYCQAEFPGSSAMNAHLALGADARVFLSGSFDSVNGEPRPGYARLLPDGRVDESFEPWRGQTNIPGRPYLPGGVYPATWLSNDGAAVMSGAIEGPRAPYPWTVYRFDPSGRVSSPSYLPHSPEFSRPSGLILTLGPAGFWARKTIDWTRDTPSARRPPFTPGKPASDLPGGAPASDLPFERWTEPPSASDAAVVFQNLFEEVPLELCTYAARSPDGAVILAVRDKVINGSLQAPGRFMRFDQSWRPDFTFTNRYETDLRGRITLRFQRDGKLLVAGLLGTLNGEPAAGLVRLEKDGSRDRGFQCQIANSLSERVMDVALQNDGRILICGFFTTVNGVPCQHLARLNPDGSLDASFKSRFISLRELNARRRFPVQMLTETAEAPSPALAGPAASFDLTSNTISITSLTYDGGIATIQFTGNPRQSYILQARDSWKDTPWANLSTNQAGPLGAGVLRDENARDYPARFYRIASP